MGGKAVANSSTRVMETTKVGKRGAIVIPAKLRRQFGFEEGSVVIVEERPEGVLVRPARVLPVEVYTAERKAEFLLSNAVDAEDYAAAREEVRKLGLDPDAVPHCKPAGA
jgi:AbrB family looped-hinge helix DNA binding protein